MYAYMEKNKNAAARGGSLSHERAAGEYRTGIPTQFRMRMEHSTGLTFDDVRIHYNSERPAALQALAYTQGSQVYLGQGQEHCLPHELGHVVQQKLGVVRANASINGLAANTDERLEQEADSMFQSGNPAQKKRMPGNQRQIPVVQRFKFVKNDQTELQNDSHIQVDLEFNREIFNSYAEWKEDEKKDRLPDAFIGIFMKKFRQKPELVVGKRYKVKSSDEKGKPILFTVRVEARDVIAANPGKRIWVGLSDYATGDQFTMAAMLLTQQYTSVIITQRKETFETCELWKTFKRTFESEAENKVEERSNQWGWMLLVNGEIRVVYQTKEVNQKKQNPYRCDQFPRFATEIVGENYMGDSWSARLRNAWGLTKNDEDLEKAKGVIIGACPRLKNIIPESGPINQEIFIIWLRHSGATGGAHLEHDTGTAAMVKLITALLKKEKNSIVILAGDNVGKQVENLVGIDKNRVFNLTEFWKSDDQTVKDFLQNDRFKQIKIYDYFVANAKSVRHIGSRSGNLELMALIGHQVNYIEEEGSYGGERMKAFNDANELYYKRIQVKKPLTFKGKLVRITSRLLKERLEGALCDTLNYSIVQDNIMKIGDVLSKGVLKRSKNDIKEEDVYSWLGQLKDSNLLKPPLPDYIVEHFAWFYRLLRYNLIDAIMNRNMEELIDDSAYFGNSIPNRYTNILYPMIHYISRTMKDRTDTKAWHKEYKEFSENELNGIFDEKADELVKSLH